MASELSDVVHAADPHPFAVSNCNLSGVYNHPKVLLTVLEFRILGFAVAISGCVLFIPKVYYLNLLLMVCLYAIRWEH